MPTAEILTYKTRNGILNPVPVSLADDKAPIKPVVNCPYCLGPLIDYREKKRCNQKLCPSNGASPEQLHQMLGKGWMIPFYTYYYEIETLIYAAYISGVIIVPVSSKVYVGYNCAIIAQSLDDFANIALFAGRNIHGYTMPARRSEEEILAEIKSMPNYYYHV